MRRFKLQILMGQPNHHSYAELVLQLPNATELASLIERRHLNVLRIEELPAA